MHRRITPHPTPQALTIDAPSGRRLPSFTVHEDEAMLAALFLGPRAENEDLFSRLVVDAVESVARFRRSYMPGDPEFIDAEMRSSEAYQRAVETLEGRFQDLLKLLEEHATPYFASRYQAHMLWDTLTPAMLGYFATMLHNPNNVTVQASTLTTFLELSVGWDLCTMFGFPFTPPDVQGKNAWGHITADGSVANIEAAWSARELKFLPLAARATLVAARTAGSDAPDVMRQLGLIASEVEVRSASTTDRLIDMATWELLNVPMAEALALPAHIATLSGADTDTVWRQIVAHCVSSVGLLDFYRSEMGDIRHSPVILTSATKHYSWPKALSLLGGGTGPDQLIDVAVDADARLDVDKLRERLEEALAERRPVTLAVAVMGSTEEGACDPLGDVLQLREDFRRQGLDFNVHADAAWGGYITSVLRKDFAKPGEGVDDPFIDDQRGVHLSGHTRRHMAAIAGADSVTVDPHKMGYIPYPAGALCYRDERMRNLVTFGAPVIGAPGTQVSVGEFGIEGSKPGAAPAAVYLAHAVLRPSTSGYGRLINSVMAAAKIFYLKTHTLAGPDDPFVCVPLARLPNEREGERDDPTWASWARELAALPYDQIVADPELLARFNELGPDQNIVDYAFNLRLPDGSLNHDIDRFNKLNEDIYDLFHVHEGKVEDAEIDYGGDIRECSIILAQTQMSVRDYGEVFMADYAARLGLAVPPVGTDFTLRVNRTVVMDPWLTHLRGSQRPFLDLIFELLAEAVTDLANDALDGVVADASGFTA